MADLDKSNILFRRIVAFSVCFLGIFLGGIGGFLEYLGTTEYNNFSLLGQNFEFTNISFSAFFLSSTKEANAMTEIIKKSGTKLKIPPIDSSVTTKTETATFALG
ncbi:MAG TPA: hypothetical protein VMW81_09825 [Nitrospinota bacterium]|nr:hypothetical protein [Nitrospinota bacterium]